MAAFLRLHARGDPRAHPATPTVTHDRPATLHAPPGTNFAGSGIQPLSRDTVTTIPPDATAMLDNRPDSACTTPCSLDATAGPHVVTISRQGYQTEHRPVTVADSAIELSPIALRVPGGVLMVASTPVGAHIFVNGTQSDKVTPAKLQLAPGKYTIMVEKDGKQSSKEVEVQNGSTGIEKFILDR